MWGMQIHIPLLLLFLPSRLPSVAPHCCGCLAQLRPFISQLTPPPTHTHSPEAEQVGVFRVEGLRSAPLVFPLRPEQRRLSGQQRLVHLVAGCRARGGG